MEQDFKQLSSLVEGRLPEFIRVDHPTLVAFLAAYYEWLQIKDREGKIVSPMVLQDVIDIDSSMDEFLTHFKQEYLLDFPEQLAVAKSTGKPVDVSKLMKNIKSFYRAKGTEKSYEFLFQILYNTSVEFYYPKKDILRVSDGKWYEKIAIKMSNALGDRIFDSVGRIIYQRNEEGRITSSAKVIDVTVYQQGQYEVAEIILTGRNGSFSVGSQGIQFDVGGEVLRELRVYSVASSVTINSGGTGYAVGDKVIFTAAGGDSGEGAVGTVSLVTATGSIRRLRIDNFGINYAAAPTVTVSSLGGSGFSGTTVVSSICQSEGYYLNSDGRIGTNKVLQDNHYYQDYSYVLKTEVVVDEYRDALRRLIHPAGTAMFGQVLIKRCSREDVFNSSALIRYEVPIIGHYIPYTFNTFDNLPDWFSIPGTGASVGTNIPVGYNPTLHDPLIVAGLFPIVPVEQTTKGNPITNIIPFVAATGPTYYPLGLTGFQNADPFWIVYEHPNRKIQGRVIAQIWRSQIDDFTTWGEWCSVTGGDPIAGWTADFYDDPTLQKKYAFLKYDDTSSFRKITNRAFFNMPIGEEFNCRTESTDSYARPIIKIINPLNGEVITREISSAQPLHAMFVIENYENCVRFGGDHINLRLDNNPSIRLELDQRTLSYNTLSIGSHKITVELVTSAGVTITGISDVVVFSYSPPVRVVPTIGETSIDTTSTGSTTDPVGQNIVCCFPDGTCTTNGISEVCVALGGTVLVGETDCTNCGTSEICCTPDWGCLGGISSSAACIALGGVMVRGSDCSACVDPNAVNCCAANQSGNCTTNRNAEDCVESGGNVVLNCSDCYSTCCLPDGTCRPNITDAACTKLGGTRIPQINNCDLCSLDDVDCCFPDGSCTRESNAVVCVGAGGTVVADCSSCFAIPPLVVCCLPDNTCTTDETAFSCILAGGNVSIGGCEDCEIVSVPTNFRVMVDDIAKSGDPAVDVAYASRYAELGVENYIIVYGSDTAKVSGVTTPVVTVTQYNNPTLGYVTINVDAVAAYLVSRGVQPNSPVKKYVSLNLDEPLWDAQIRGGANPTYGIVADTTVNGTNNTLVTTAVTNAIRTLKNIFGSNVKFNSHKYPYLPFYFGGMGGGQGNADPNGSWMTTTPAWKEARIAWTTTQYQPIYQAFDWSTVHTYDYIPTRASVEAGLVENVQSGVDYDYKNKEEKIDEWRIAHTEVVERILRNLEVGSEFEQLPSVSRNYVSGVNVVGDLYFPSDGHLIPADDTVAFVQKLRIDRPNINGIALWGGGTYRSFTLPFSPDVLIPSDVGYAIPSTPSWFIGTSQQWEAYAGQKSINDSLVQTNIRNSYVRVLYGGVSPIPETYSSWTDSRFKIDFVQKYHDYTLDMIQRIMIASTGI